MAKHTLFTPKQILKEGMSSFFFSNQVNFSEKNFTSEEENKRSALKLFA